MLFKVSKVLPIIYIWDFLTNTKKKPYTSTQDHHKLSFNILFVNINVFQWYPKTKNLIMYRTLIIFLLLIKHENTPK